MELGKVLGNEKIRHPDIQSVYAHTYVRGGGGKSEKWVRTARHFSLNGPHTPLNLICEMGWGIEAEAGLARQAGI